MVWFYGFFLLSGFCSILYELVWLRLIMARFSVSTPFVSIVLAVFMLGLGAGSWLAGRWAARLQQSARLPGLTMYALTELLIGVSALLVPLELAWGKALIASLAGGAPLHAGLYYTAAGLWIALALGPWCACMGATFPFAMLAVRQLLPRRSSRSFSYLYLANLSGAVLGTLIPLLLIETSGFQATLRVGLVANLSVALGAFLLARAKSARDKAPGPPTFTTSTSGVAEPRALLGLLFATGLTTMGGEVVWVRLFTPFLGTVVYAFAAILGAYLLSTYLGSALYRLAKPQLRPLSGLGPAALGLAALLPVLAADPQWHWPKVLRILLGILPFSVAAGFITPMLLDRYSGGDPRLAGQGYAVNIAGCVAGPLLAGFVLLPLAGERLALLTFGLPWLALGLLWTTPTRSPAGFRRWLPWAALPAAAVLLLAAGSYEQQYRPRRVLRDHTATVVAAGANRLDKRLILNGVTTTTLTPITKFMAHLPLASLPHEPRSALVICFGMGTTHRSMLSWGIHSTAVDLTPSVPRMFSWFHADAASLLSSPRSTIVIDDGRSFLERTRERFDVIAVDPPPPVEAAASSLLYSKEFYALARPRLAPGGILQQWLPRGDAPIHAAVAKALAESFPHVRVFQSVEGWGYHFLAGESALIPRTAEALAARLPPQAASDLVEWGPSSDPSEQFARVLRQEVAVQDLIRLSPHTPPLTDDRPVNEYYLLRRWRW